MSEQRHHGICCGSCTLIPPIHYPLHPPIPSLTLQLVELPFAPQLTPLVLSIGATVPLPLSATSPAIPFLTPRPSVQLLLRVSQSVSTATAEVAMQDTEQAAYQRRLLATVMSLHLHSSISRTAGESTSTSVNVSLWRRSDTVPGTAGLHCMPTRAAEDGAMRRMLAVADAQRLWSWQRQAVVCGLRASGCCWRLWTLYSSMLRPCADPLNRLAHP